MLTRVVPRHGRSRAYRDGRLITAAELAELAASLVDLHGQHAHVGLLTTASQRRALDRFAGVDLADLEASRAAVRRRRGGAAGARWRRAAPASARSTSCASSSTRSSGSASRTTREDERLAAEESLLADADAHRAAAGGRGRSPSAPTEAPATCVAAALGELDGPVAVRSRPSSACGSSPPSSTTWRAISGPTAESIDGDPERLAAVQARRAELADLRRRYTADARSSLAELFAVRDELSGRLAGLDAPRRAGRGRRGGSRRRPRRPSPRAAAVVGERRRGQAGALAAAVPGSPDRAGPRRRRRSPSPSATTTPATTSPSCSPSTRACRRRRWPRRPPAASWRARCWRCGWWSARRCRRSSSTRSMPGWAGARPGRWGGPSPRWPSRSRCSSSPTCRRSPPSPTPRSPSASTTTAPPRRCAPTSLGPEARVRELARMLSGLADSDTGQDHAEELLATAAAERGR